MSDVAARYTFDFLSGELPYAPARHLEVGCGNGAVAQLLSVAGHSIVALDSNPDAVERAKSKGIDARIANWPNFADGRFDAVLFTRSLHHMPDLRCSTEAAFECLRDGGCVIVEDFDAAYEDAESLGIFAGMVRMIRASSAQLNPDALLEGLASAQAEIIDIWRSEHHHDLHSAAAIEAALKADARSVAGSRSAYFFRYIDEACADEELVQTVLDFELNLIGTDRIEPLGRRLVARFDPERPM